MLNAQDRVALQRLRIYAEEPGNRFDPFRTDIPPGCLAELHGGYRVIYTMTINQNGHEVRQLSLSRWHGGAQRRVPTPMVRAVRAALRFTDAAETTSPAGVVHVVDHGSMREVGIEG